MNKNLLLLPVLLMPHVSKGALIASDAFDYAAGALATQNGGTGFSGGWGNQVAATVNATGLNYSGLATSGRSANLSGDGVSIFRGLTTAGGGSGTNVWMSFLIESAGGNAGISYFDGGNEQTFAGRVGGNGINGFGTLFYKGAGRPIVDAAAGNLGAPFTPASSDTNSHMFVLQIDQTGATPVYRGWLDPDAADLGTGAAPTSGSTFTVNTDTQFFNYTQLRMGLFSGVGASVNFDELRLGDTWADVSPAGVPEPSSLLLLSVGALGLLRRRR